MAGAAVRLLAVAVAMVISGAIAACSDERPTTGSTATALATDDAHRFLASYVDADGRVVRHDQGGDTVSEGQGYALLLDVAVGDPGQFARVWGWTRSDLQLPSGLFAYHWSDGHISSSQPAADADTQIAWALDLAGQEWRQASYTAAAKRIAEAIANREIGYDDEGRPTLVAGPWAMPSGQAATVEPGYWTFPADTALASLTTDHRWQALAASDLSHLQQLTRDGQTLPPDWATVGDGSSIEPVSAPDGTQPQQSGLDGQRALIWARCTPGGQQLDAAWWSLIAPTASQAPLSRSLSGAPDDADKSPLADVSAAAAASAANHQAVALKLLSAADGIEGSYPSYYGAAWVALGRILLTTSRLPGC